MGEWEYIPPVPSFNFFYLPDTLKDLYYGGTRKDWDKCIPAGQSDSVIKACLTDQGITLHFSDGTTIEGKKTDPDPGDNDPDKPNPPVNPDPPVTPSEPTVETVTTEAGNTATITTQPGVGKEIEVKTPSGETVAKVNLPADPGKGKTFTDVKGWYEGAVDKATAYGLFQGTSETRFNPDSSMTRGMLATVLHNLSSKSQYGVGEGVFTDVAENIWYEDAADWAAKTGVTSGTGKTEFSPNRSVTRQDMVTMLYHYAKLIGADSKNSAGLEKFPDAGKVAGYAKEAMQWAVAEGFISGRASGGKNYIAPQGTATRAEVAAVLTRFVEYLKK